jgi:hypothetical protein
VSNMKVIFGGCEKMGCGVGMGWKVEMREGLPHPQSTKLAKYRKRFIMSDAEVGSAF